MAVYSTKKTYHTRKFCGMIKLDDDAHKAVKDSGIQNGLLCVYGLGCTSAITTIEFEPGLVHHDIEVLFQRLIPFRDTDGNIIPYKHHDTWHDQNGSSHLQAMLLSPQTTIPICEGVLMLGEWQNITLIELDPNDRTREVIFQIVGE